LYIVQRNIWGRWCGEGGMGAGENRGCLIRYQLYRVLCRMMVKARGDGDRYYKQDSSRRLGQPPVALQFVWERIKEAVETRQSGTRHWAVSAGGLRREQISRRVSSVRFGYAQHNFSK
jgi:hypothetical protein